MHYRYGAKLHIIYQQISQGAILRYTHCGGNKLHDKGKIWCGVDCMEEPTSSTPNFTLISAGVGCGVGPKNEYNAILDIQCSAGMHVLRDFYKIFSVCGQFLA